MTTTQANELGQLVGLVVEGWTPRPAPPRAPIDGTFCRLEPLSPDLHAADLYAELGHTDPRNWTYLSIGPFEDSASFHAWVTAAALSADTFFAVIDRRTGRAAGVAALMRIDRPNGVIEIGSIHFSESLKRTREATEAIYLLLKLVFSLGYRRCEWKCNALNEPSRRAALRFGFQFEGIFRQALLVKGRNRDTAWFSVIDGEWPALQGAYEAWLAPSNFTRDGKEKQKLAKLVAKARSG